MTKENPQVESVELQENQFAPQTASASISTEPVVEKVTDPEQKNGQENAFPKDKTKSQAIRGIKEKDPKRVAVSHRSAAARKAKEEERLLSQLKAAKQSFRPSDVPSFPLERHQRAESKIHTQAGGMSEALEPAFAWTPWVIGACLAGGILFAVKNADGFAARARTEIKHPVKGAASPMTESLFPKETQRHLNERDPFHME